MNLLVPGALGLAALAGPLIVLYMLRSKRRQVEVPSTMLWERLDDSVSSAVPWQPLRWTALLFLQLLVLALFVLSLARPFSNERALLGPHTVMVIDTSGSMSTAGRLERAILRARSIARDVSAANQVSVVTAGPQPEVRAAFARTRAAVDEALDSVAPTGGPSRLDDAITLARGLATPDRPTSLLILSDGSGAALASEPVQDATHLAFDASDEDVSIDVFTPESSGEGVLRGFLGVTNHGSSDAVVSVTITVDGLSTGTTELTVAAGATTSDLVGIDASPGAVVEARISSLDGRVGGETEQIDANSLNDRSWFILGGGPQRGVSVVGSGSPFLSALIDVAPGFGPADGPADLLIVDGGPMPDVDRPVWILRSEAPPEGLRPTALARNVVVTSQRPGEPILDGVDLSRLAVAEAQVVETNSWTPIVSAGDVPLFLLGEVNGHRAVYTTFDLTHSNLPVDVAFPVMGTRLLQWLVGASAGSVSTGVAGDPIAITPPPGAQVVVTHPDGTTETLSSRTGDFRNTGLPGVYRVDYVGEEGGVEPGPVAVRTFDAAESASSPRDIAVTDSPGAAEDETSIVRELAPWMVATALALMAVEWWVGHQRPRLWGRSEAVGT